MANSSASQFETVHSQPSRLGLRRFGRVAALPLALLVTALPGCGDGVKAPEPKNFLLSPGVTFYGSGPNKGKQELTLIGCLPSSIHASGGKRIGSNLTIGGTGYAANAVTTLGDSYVVNHARPKGDRVELANTAFVNKDDNTSEEDTTKKGDLVDGHALVRNVNNLNSKQHGLEAYELQNALNSVPKEFAGATCVIHTTDIEYVRQLRQDGTYTKEAPVDSTRGGRYLGIGFSLVHYDEANDPNSLTVLETAHTR